MMEIADRVRAVRARMAAAAARSGRDPASIALIAVTKTAAPAQVAAVIEAGVLDLGENRVADGEARIAAVAALRGAAARIGDAGAEAVARAHAQPRWHFIGHLQSNKARRAVQAFDSIDSVDTVALAERLSALAAEAGRTLPVLIEVNIARDPARGGFAPDVVDDCAGHIVALPHLRVDGLMGIAPLTGDVAEQRSAFAQLQALHGALVERYPTHSLPTLSMGMSDDFEAAIEAGSTQVRIGRALFDEEG